jgi:hypothetical protein
MRRCNPRQWNENPKGASFLEIHLRKERPSDEELLKLVIGLTGNLRAPKIRIGKQLVVGFSDAMDQKL